ncbi:MAG: cell division/cell wall cluster transcriptional repressor MraZ [Clostridiales bacterium]|nr:cell division/cell wall cluster transcriptional repressor MraZ [Clostridiales bacterium]
MFFFTGEYNHQLDGKNRIRIPAKLKKELGDRYFFAKGTDGCIFVFHEETVNALLEEISQIKISDEEKQKGARKFSKSIILAEEDSQGRVTLPGNLKKFAKIEKDIKICGSGKRIEIWAKSVYDEYFGDEDDDASYDENIKALGI